MNDKFNGVAVVTGGGSGIGKAIALALSEQGASVAVADIVLENAEAVAESIVAQGGYAIGFACDVSDRASVASLRSDVSERLAPASLLVANAGVVTFERLTDMSDDDLDWMIGVNLFGVTNCLRAFLPDMIAARQGHVVATASQAALLPASGPFRTAYVTAKSGVMGLMFAMRHELAEFGIGSTVVCPGRVETQIANSAHHRPERYGGAGDKRVELPPLSATPGLMARPAAELAELVIRAIRHDQAVVVTDPSSQEMYEHGIVDAVRSAYAATTAFDRERDGARAAISIDRDRIIGNSDRS